MKYSALKTGEEKVFCAPIPDKGVNFAKDETQIDDNQLADCKNLYLKDGKIKTRMGITADIQNILDISDMQGAKSVSYEVCGEIFIDGNFEKIVTAKVDYDDSHCFVYVFLISADSAVKSIGNMHFSRVDSSIFYSPCNITFYKGAAVQGGGIFALVTLENKENTIDRDYRIYEVNSVFDGWELNYSSYIPTVYINGRGNNFDSIEKSGVGNTAEPRILEPLNLLGGSFYSYFSSDGYSSFFRLPYGDLADTTVIVRINSSLDSFTEWIVGEGKNEDTQMLLNSEVIMQVDREKGTVYFKSESGEYAIPVMSMCKENNIRVLAQKNMPEGRPAVISARCAVACGQSIVLAGGIEGNKIYYADYENPLYFPLITDNSVGSPDRPVNALIAVNDTVYAFKESEFFAVDIKRGKALNTTELLADNGKIFKATYSFSVKCLDKTIGCTNPESLTLFENLPIWATKDGRVCRLESNKVRLLSDNIDKLINKEFTDEIFAGAVISNNYILCNGNKAAIMNYGDRLPAWYIWRLPESVRLLGVLANNGEIAFICKTADGTLCYTAGLSGECDRLIDNSGTLVTYPIESYIKTKRFNLGGFSSLKRINRIFLQLWAEGSVKFTVCSDRKSIELKHENFAPRCEGECVLRMLTDLHPIRSVQLTISSHKGITLGETDIYYFE